MSTDFSHISSWGRSTDTQGMEGRSAAEKMNGQRLQGFPSSEETSCTPSKGGSPIAGPKREGGGVTELGLVCKGKKHRNPLRTRGLVSVSVYSTVSRGTLRGINSIWTFPLYLEVNPLNHEDTVSKEKSQIFILFYLVLLCFKQSISQWVIKIIMCIHLRV